MSYTFQQVLDLLGDEAQSCAGSIIVFRGKHIEVAKSHVGGAFEVTAEGLELLNAQVAAAEPEAPKPAKRTKKTEQVVESANALVDDLSLGD